MPAGCPRARARARVEARTRARARANPKVVDTRKNTPPHCLLGKTTTTITTTRTDAEFEAVRVPEPVLAAAVVAVVRQGVARCCG